MTGPVAADLGVSSDCESDAGARERTLVTVGGVNGVGGGSLMVSGGGSTKVATGELFAESAVVRRVEADTEDWLSQVKRIRSLAPDSHGEWMHMNGNSDFVVVDRAIREIRDDATELAGALDAAAEAYGTIENHLQRLFRSVGADVGWVLGLTSHLWLPGVGISAAAAAIGTLLASMITGTPLTQLSAEVARWVADHPEMYTNPAFVELVGVLVASVDDAVEGRVGVPLWLTRLLGDDQLAILGASTSAAGLSLLLQPTGIGRRTPVVVTPVGGPKPAQPPKNYADAIGRIPKSVPGIPQILIEKYPGPDGAVWFVYVGGTVDWSAVPTDEPFDMSSNLQGVGQLAAGSQEAVEKAMREAGIQTGDSVQAFGHSQGGLIVAQVAASKTFPIDGVTTYGAPSGQVDVRVSTMAFENSDDAVVATGGKPREPSGDRLVVGHQAYLEKDVPKGQGMPAHQIAAYTDTAGLADSSEDPRVMKKKEATFNLGVGAGVALAWRADRVEPRGGGGGRF